MGNTRITRDSEYFSNYRIICFLFTCVLIFYCVPNVSSASKCKRRISSNEIETSQSLNAISGRPSPVPADDLASGRILPSSSRTDDPLPPWINLTLARQGQRFAKTHLLAGFFGAIFGLIPSIAIPDNKNILLFTQNSDTPAKVVSRYTATAAQTLVWYRDDLKTDPTNNAFLTSISHVRQLHANVAARVSSHKKPIINPRNYEHIKVDEEMWAAFNADLVESNIPKEYRQYSEKYLKYDKESVPINQFTHGTTQFAFFGYLLLNPKSVFAHDASDEDLNGFVHLWAIIGYAIGLEDEYNICLQPDLKSAQKYFKQIENNYYIPTLFNLDHTAKVLVEALVHGYNDYFPGIGARLVMFRFLREIIRIPVYNMASILSISDHLAQLAFDYKFVPGTRIRSFADAIEGVFNSAFDVIVATLFGDNFTNMRLARNVFYNGTAGFGFRDESCSSKS